jgi:hypothetical protein
MQMRKPGSDDLLSQYRQHAGRTVGQRDPAQISLQSETQLSGSTAVFKRMPVMRQRHPLAKRRGNGERPLSLDRIRVPGLCLVVKIHRSIHSIGVLAVWRDPLPAGYPSEATGGITFVRFVLCTGISSGLQAS